MSFDFPVELQSVEASLTQSGSTYYQLAEVEEAEEEDASFIKPQPEYWNDLSNFVIAVRGGDEISKYCWQCFHKKSIFSLQFKQQSVKEQGFICFDCGMNCETPAYQKLALSSVEHSFSYQFLVTQANKCKGYAKDEDSRVSAPVLYYPATLEELQYQIDGVKKRFYPAHYLLQVLNWMLTRKNLKIKRIHYLNQVYFVYAASAINSPEDIAAYLEIKEPQDVDSDLSIM